MATPRSAKEGRGLVTSFTGFVTFVTPGAPHVINPRKFCKLDGEFCCHEFCYYEAFEAQKRVLTRLEDNTDNMQSQDKH